MINGIDISNVNGHVDLGSLRQQRHLSFAAVKATEGTGFLDADFPASWQALARLGLARIAYHFAHPSNSPVAEADHFLGYVRQHGLHAADMLALDLEDADGLPPAAVAAYGRAWCAHVQQATGYRPLAYTFLSFAEAGCCAGLGNYPLWIADPDSPPGKPRVPAPWSAWSLHQYGQRGIDLDIGNYPSAAAMTAALGQPPAPKPAPKGWTAAMLADLPELAEGADDKHLPHWYVRRAQIMVNGVFGATPPLTEDGVFGAATANALAVIQCDFRLGVTRRLDAATWALLLAAVTP